MANKPPLPPTPKAKMKPETMAYLAMAVMLPIYIYFQLYTPADNAQDAGMSTAALRAQLGQAKPKESAENRFRREQQSAPLPDGSKLAPDYIAKQTRLFEQTPFGDSEMTFRLNLPTNWVSSNFAKYGLPGEEDYRVLTNVARFFGPAVVDALPYVWVEAMRVKTEVSAADLAQSYFIKRAINPESLHVVDDNRVDTLFVDVRDQNTYAVRGLFLLNGDNLVLMTFGVPIESYAEYKDMMGLTVKSFALLNPVNRVIEPRETAKLLNVLSYRYFSSWQIVPQLRSTTLQAATELHNVADNGNLKGLVFIQAWRKNSQFSDDKAEKALNDRLAQSNLYLREVINEKSELTSDFKQKFKRSQQKVMAAIVGSKADTQIEQFGIVRKEENLSRQEVWITTLDNDFYVVNVVLVTPPQASGFMTWAENVNAYKFLLSSLNVRSLQPVVGEGE